MALNKLKTYKLGELIELYDEKNSDNEFSRLEDIQGVNNIKQFQPYKAKYAEMELNSYRKCRKGMFACNKATSRNGEKISIAYRTGGDCIVSPSYYCFWVKREDVLSPLYLNLYFSRPEFDRFAVTNSWGSATEFFTWEQMCDVEILLPTLSVQQKYVDIYESMVANQKSYEKGLDDLKLTCDAYIEELRRKMPCEKIGPYIQPIDERNSKLAVKLAQGITNEKEFATPKQVAEEERNAKIVRKGMFAYNRATTRNGEKISIAYRTGEDCVVSSAYQVFEITDNNHLYPEYLMMWFKRSEFDRYARYMSKGSAHEFFEFDDMCDVQIPIPDIKIQKSIASIYKVYTQRKAINEKLKVQIRDICPILIKGSLEA